MATIKDVAARAGVSIKSVSRVLNNEPHVRDSLRERVLEAARELGYRPNQAARRMAGRRSFLIAFLYRNPDPPYVAGVQSGAAQYCREQGYHLVVEPVPYDKAELDEVVLRLVHTLAPDAIFVAPPLSDDEDFLDIVRRVGVRLIRIAGLVEGPGENIAIDDRKPAYEVTRHLIELGHRRIAFIRSPPGHLAASERYDGYCDAMSESGIGVDPALVGDGYFTFASGHETGHKLLTQAERPTAIFAANDEMALGAVAAARELGLALPDDLSVAGFDDIPAASTNWPPLTTVRQPFGDYGAAAACLAIGGKLPDGIDLRNQLVVRSSTARPKS